MAKKGDPTAQFNLGILYGKGQGVEKNQGSSFYWMKKSAVQGKAEAQFSLALKYFLGYAYFYGINGDTDWGKAETWLIKAKNQGVTKAQKLLDQIN